MFEKLRYNAEFYNVFGICANFIVLGSPTFPSLFLGRFAVAGVIFQKMWHSGVVCPIGIWKQRGIHAIIEVVAIISSYSKSVPGCGCCMHATAATVNQHASAATVNQKS